MKALTITQPYATLIAIGAKRIETRSWATTYRGPLAIHAAAGLGPVGGERGLLDLCRSTPFRSVLLNAGYLGTPALPRGAIVATCRLIDVCPIVTPWGMGMPDYTQRGMYIEINNHGGRNHDVTGNEYAFGDYTPGRFAWLLADVQPLDPPIPARGALGLWEWNQP